MEKRQAECGSSPQDKVRLTLKTTGRFGQVLRPYRREIQILKRLQKDGITREMCTNFPKLYENNYVFR